ncbi:uncharacterized protein B0H18DRAFT_884702 [Fomitopsis serialis]|uniref:uncharacterized protein n=1 Tax=Fomitopsis serialis TaxID=139415 RepID=UPI0020075933|nr:uncharacterized protein B0H18DRAFT_884702 [Neoantrodia serialis]KAH9916630.1 hypothetical protein B0H18DRAFT_884702 [Neoantrodia serialis]
MAAFSSSESQLVALFVACIAYGIHIVAFVACMRTWTHHSKHSPQTNTYWPWVSASVSLFLLGTLHVSGLCAHSILAFICYRGSHGTDGDFKQLGRWIYGLRCICYHLVVAVSDAALVRACLLTKNLILMKVPGLSLLAGLHLLATEIRGHFHSCDPVAHFNRRCCVYCLRGRDTPG